MKRMALTGLISSRDVRMKRIRAVFMAAAVFSQSSFRFHREAQCGGGRSGVTGGEEGGGRGLLGKLKEITHSSILGRFSVGLIAALLDSHPSAPIGGTAGGGGSMSVTNRWDGGVCHAHPHRRRRVSERTHCSH